MNFGNFVVAKVRKKKIYMYGRKKIIIIRNYKRGTLEDMQRYPQHFLVMAFHDMNMRRHVNTDITIGR